MPTAAFLLPRHLLLLAGLSLPGAALATVAGADAGAGDDIATVATVEFNAALLQFPVDVRLFADGKPLPAGVYRADMQVNRQWKGRADLRFELRRPEDRVALPCFDLALLEMLELDAEHLNTQARKQMQQGEQVCHPLAELIPGTSAHYDSATFKLIISAPQSVMQRSARGYVEPALWDDGITAATLNYSYNGYRSESARFGSRSSHYLGLRAGLNLGAWRLRYRASAHHNDATGFHYHGDSAYLERSLRSWKSRLTFGDTVTDGRVFNSLRLRGARLDSDERMRPDSQRGFAPVVRGIANSTAKVQISQLGQQIYEVTVPPGPFVIDDLYPTGIGGDLLVTMTEADGSEHTFSIAYAATAELVRPGSTHYTLAAGRYRNQGLVNAPVFAMGHLRHGLNNRLTGYTGLLVGEGYSALSGGLAFNIPLGALAVDGTFANTRTQAGRYRGSSVRATWAKRLPVLNTNVTLASYRYSSGGFYDPAEAFMLRDRVAYNAWLPGERLLHPKNRLVLNANQALPGRLGHLGISASSQDYWWNGGRDTQYQVIYNRMFQRASIGLAASRTHNTFYGRWDNQYMLNVSMPLGEERPVHMNSSYLHRADGPSLQTSVSGSFGEQQQLGLNAFITADHHDHTGDQYGGGVNMAWNGSRAQLGANLSLMSGGNRQYGVSVNGGMVAFGGGLVLSSRLGETIAIVEAKGAAGARVDNAVNLRLNRRGQAVVPSLQAYRQNTLKLDPKGLSTDVALIATAHKVAPTAGAVALLRFATEQGYSILLRGRRSDGGYLPFAAAVLDANGREVGHVAQGGQALLRVHAPSGSLSVRWGDGDGQRCDITYDLSASTGPADTLGFRHLDAVCTSHVLAAQDMQPVWGTMTGDTP